MASNIPQGAMSNLPPNEDRQASFLAFFYTTLGIGTLVVALRLYVRFKIRSLGVDDWLMLATWLVWTANVIIGTLYSVSGGTKHAAYITDPVTTYRYDALFGATASVSQGLGKLSVGALIIRLMVHSAHKVHKIMIYIFMAIWAIMVLLLVILQFVQCNPVRAQWDPTTTKPGSCWDISVYTDFSITTASFGTFLDFFLAASPIPIILPLTLKLSRKIILCGLLGLGVLAGICSAAKTAQLADIKNLTDETWDTYNINMLSNAETSLIVICGCIPTLKPFYEFLAHGTKMTPSDRSSDTTAKLRSFFRAPTKLSSESQDRCILDQHNKNIGYLVQSQTGDGTESPPSIPGIQCTQSFEIQTYEKELDTNNWPSQKQYSG